MEALLLATGVILLAELGDKSQLMVLAFATRYRPAAVLLAVLLAAALVCGVSVLVGSAAAVVLPTSAIDLAAGVAFLGFAWWTFRGDGGGSEGTEAAPRPIERGGGWTLLAIGSTFFLAELGDKTMLATIALAATEDPIAVWLGATLGMVIADALAIGIGAVMGARLPERAIRLFAATTFVVFGAVLVAQGLGVL